MHTCAHTHTHVMSKSQHNDQLGHSKTHISSQWQMVHGGWANIIVEISCCGWVSTHTNKQTKLWSSTWLMLHCVVTEHLLKLIIFDHWIKGCRLSLMDIQHANYFNRHQHFILFGIFLKCNAFNSTILTSGHLTLVLHCPILIFREQGGWYTKATGFFVCLFCIR